MGSEINVARLPAPPPTSPACVVRWRCAVFVLGWGLDLVMVMLRLLTSFLFRRLCFCPLLLFWYVAPCAAVARCLDQAPHKRHHRRGGRRAGRAAGHGTFANIGQVSYIILSFGCCCFGFCAERPRVRRKGWDGRENGL